METVEAPHAASLLCTAPAALRSRLALLLSKTGSAVFEACEDDLREIGLDERDYTALAILSEEEPRSQLEFARLTNCAPALIVAIVDALEAQGFAVRERDPADRRRSLVRITDAGRTALARADARAAEHASEVLSGLDEDERAQLLALLQRAVPAAEVVATA